MDAGGIYLIRNEDGNEVLVEMRPTPYDREDILQALVARFPNLLVGDAADGAHQRWLLVGREAAPDDEDGGGRWSVDHLFLDQDAVPTLVEVKRAKDTRIRREVVGQVLDYAANAVVYWPIERLRELFVRECERSGSDPEELVAAVLGADGDVEEFWQRADENLRAGRLRLVFVADEIPRELRRVIEFLNGQMLAEVLGIEVRQYVGEGLKTLVPKTGRADCRSRDSQTTIDQGNPGLGRTIVLRRPCRKTLSRGDRGCSSRLRLDEATRLDAAFWHWRRSHLPSGPDCERIRVPADRFPQQRHNPDPLRPPRKAPSFRRPRHPHEATRAAEPDPWHLVGRRRHRQVPAPVT